jgi:hypothetical protein
VGKTPEEISWHPDGADLPWWALAGLLTLMGAPVLGAVYLITTL